MNRAARVMSAGHGGQIVCSAPTAALCRDAVFRDAGLHLLAGVGPERLFVAVPASAAGPDASDPRPLRSIGLAPTNLAGEASSFVGRENEVAEVALLGSPRLVSLVGPGGIGKTRLAVETAAAVSALFSDGVWFCDLAPLGEGTRFPPRWRTPSAPANNSPDPFVRAVVASFSCLGVFATDEASGLAGLARACDLAAALDNDAALAFANYQTGNMQFAVGNYDSALAAYERCIELSSYGKVRMFELWARTMLAARATDAGWADAEQRFADSLRYLADNRIWSRVYAVLASLADYWCGADRVERAATLIGFLEVRDPIGLFLVACQRERAVDKVNAHPDAVPWKARGASIDRNAIIDYALAELSSPT